MIVLEDVFSALFNKLNPITRNGITANPVFGYGDDNDLNRFLAEREKDLGPYPLVWLLLPYEQEYENRGSLSGKQVAEVERLQFVLAVETNTDLRIEQRLDITYKQVLYPLFDDVMRLIKSTSVIKMNDGYKVRKYPLYLDELNSEKANTIIVWDALKIIFDCKINNNCLN